MGDNQINSKFNDKETKNLDTKNIKLNSSINLNSKQNQIANFNFLTGKFSANTNMFTQSLKSEFKIADNKTMPPILKPIVDDFLHQTSLTKFDKTKELPELNNARLNLANSKNYNELLDNILSLAKLYHSNDYLEEAKLATTLSLSLDPENEIGKELFAKLEQMHSLETQANQNKIAYYLNKNDLMSIIQKFDEAKVLVIGDLIIDELWEGSPKRISREAPVMILEHVETINILGGAANTANNISSLDGNCHSIGIAGDDQYFDILKQTLESKKITHNLLKDFKRKTTVKTRVISKSHSQMQQLIRLDRIDYHPIDNELEKQIIEIINKCAQNFDAIVLSDYRCGLISQAIIETCVKIKHEQNKFVIVDAQSNFERFKNVSMITPNQPDTEKMLNKKIDDNYSIYEAGVDVLNLTDSDCALITRGEHGMTLFEKPSEIFELPAFNLSQVFDVTGAGDTVVATIACALSVGANYKQAIALGNLAAGIVVKKPGTATVSRKELIENLENLNF